MNGITATLQYGALGLLGTVIAGLFWYVRAVEGRQARREEKEQERQEKYLDVLVKLTATLAIFSSKQEAHDQRVREEQEAHDQRMREEHQGIIDACERFSQRGIGE